MAYKKNKVGIIMNKTFCGIEVSDYAQEKGWVDYETLSKVVGSMVLCNEMGDRLGITLNFIANEYLYDNIEVFKWYIITPSGKRFLTSHFQDELIFYDHEIDVYVWGITHLGTSWDCVLTDMPL